MVSSEANLNATEIDRPEETSLEPLSRDDEWTSLDARYWPVALFVLCLGIGLRQLWLADFPYHPDEAIHAWFPLGFMGYNFDPVYHGPLLYHLQALVYSVLWPDDYTARLVPSLLGIGLLAIIIGPTRRYLGDRAALWSLAMIAISPVILTYQRRLLHDSLVLVLTLGAVLCFQAASDNPSHTPAGRKARVGLAILLALFVSTKANAFFIIAMLAAFWLMTKIKARLKARWNHEHTASERVAFVRWVLPTLCLLLTALVISVILKLITTQPIHLAARFAPVLLLIIAIGWLFLCERSSETCASIFWKWLPTFLLFVVSIASILALRDPPAWKEIIEPAYIKTCVLCVAILWFWLLAAPRCETGDIPPNGSTALPENEKSASRRFDILTPALGGWAAILIFAFLFGHGFLWYQSPVRLVQNPSEWVATASASARSIGIAAWQPVEKIVHLDVGEVREASTRVISDNLIDPAARPGPGILSSAPDWYDVNTAFPKMIAYWGNQQKNPRLADRHDYYIVLMLLYELPIVLAGLGGIVHACRKRTPFTDLLLWWVFTSFTLYALANEKVPWLLVHIMLPWTLLAGVWLAHARYEAARKNGVFYCRRFGRDLFVARRNRHQLRARRRPQRTHVLRPNLRNISRRII